MALKLGTETNSLVNHLMSGHVGGPAPEVGMGATKLMWTDRHACTIRRVSPCGKKFWMTEDKATRTNVGMREDQQWAFETVDGPEILVCLTKRGWRCGGVGGDGVRVGSRDHYYDYSF